MEAEGLASEASWSSFDPAMAMEESEAVMAQLFGSHDFANEQDQNPRTGIQQMFWSDHNVDYYYCSDDSYWNPYYRPQSNCSTNSTDANCGGYYLSNPHMAPAMIGEQIATPSCPVGVYDQFSEPVVCMNEETSGDDVVDSFMKPHLVASHASQAIKRRLHGDDLEVPTKTEEGDIQIEGPKKKARSSASAPKKVKNAQSKKAQKSAGTANEEESNADMNPQSSYGYSSEDGSNGSQELKGAGSMSSSLKGSEALNPNGKRRAGRGSATDPQSLYARKRRERINERLKILQNLVPNGTKVDISTMLEEAVQYVKFLQLQIKLLSSDELWMYAPIAYNGMNLGFDLNISGLS